MARGNAIDRAAKAAFAQEGARQASAQATKAATAAGELSPLKSELWDLTGQAVPILATGRADRVISAYEHGRTLLGGKKTVRVDRAAWKVCETAWRKDGGDYITVWYLLSTRMFANVNGATVDIRDVDVRSEWMTLARRELARIVLTGTR